MPDLSSILDEVDTLTLELNTLSENDFYVISLVIPFFMQLFPTPPPLIFHLFAEEDEAQTIVANRGREHAEQSDNLNELRQDIKTNTMESII